LISVVIAIQDSVLLLPLSSAAFVKGCQIPALNRRSNKMQQPSAGRRLTSLNITGKSLASALWQPNNKIACNLYVETSLQQQSIEAIEQ
jgi:hypothetical protein